MTDTEKLKLLLEAAGSMRKLQIMFFKEPVKARKKEILKKAIEKEQMFDRLVFSFRQTSFDFGERYQATDKSF